MRLKIIESRRDIKKQKQEDEPLADVEVSEYFSSHKTATKKVVKPSTRASTASKITEPAPKPVPEKKPTVRSATRNSASAPAPLTKHSEKSFEIDSDDDFDIIPAIKKKPEPKKEIPSKPEPASPLRRSTRTRSKAIKDEEEGDDDDYNDDKDKNEDIDDDDGEFDNDNDDDDDDIETVTVAPVMASKKRAIPSSAKSSQSSPSVNANIKPPTKAPVKASAKAPTKAPVKAPAKAPAKPSTSTSSNSPRSAEQVLASIPDAILPDTDPNAKHSYRDFMANRAGGDVPGFGSDDIEIPVARENCLAGMKVVFTGVLPHISREQGTSIVKTYGGEVPKSLSGRTTVVVIGADAGPSKIQKIKDMGTKTIDEDGFLQLLRDMPASGGSGEQAHKAMLKKKEEERKIEEAAKAMDREMEKRYTEQTGSEITKKKKTSTSSSTSSASSKENGIAIPPKVSPDEELWTTKYAPTDYSQIIGNSGAIRKLQEWLRNWKKNSKSGFKKPGPDGSGIFRAVMLHGPPGIGKTTAAHLVAKLEGFDLLENNASDTRSKSLLVANIMSTLSNTSLNGYFATASKEKVEKKNKNLILVMDEVDGMSGGDRGGVGQMAALCRVTNIPIICICNERTLPKMRPFDRVTFDIPFRRPDANAARVRIMSIAKREKLNLDPGVVDQLVASTHSDIRQIINILSTFSRTKDSLSSKDSVEVGKAWEKHTVLKPFDIVGRLFSGATFAPSSKMKLNEKIELYFHDHDFTPLMVQENYLNTIPAKSGSDRVKHLAAVVKAAESISDGDLVDAKIHGAQQQWSLMPLHAVTSSVRPSSFIAGQGRTRFNFTSYLGNNSKRGKYERLLQEIHSHARLRISGDRQEVRQDYLPLLTAKLLLPILKQGSNGVEDVISVMDDYYLTKEDWDVIMELGVGPKKPEDLIKGIPTAIKSGFTRKYNSTSHPVPFMRSASSLSAKAVSGGSGGEVPDLEETLGEEPSSAGGGGGGDDDDDGGAGNGGDNDDDITKDKYIKMAKPKAKGKATSKRVAGSSASQSAPKRAARGTAKGRSSTR